MYDLSDEINLTETGIDEILEIIEKRKASKNYLPLNVDSIIGLISSNEGINFRKEFLLRNIKGAEDVE